ncbi:MAG: hypothetical protein Q4C73_01150 [Eubacteriales bacterium]|nr:hypothetical protein [Eubacteriales bacterium]
MKINPLKKWKRGLSVVVMAGLLMSTLQPGLGFASQDGGYEQLLQTITDEEDHASDSNAEEAEKPSTGTDSNADTDTQDHSASTDPDQEELENDLGGDETAEFVNGGGVTGC